MILRASIALGSNLGDRLENLKQARDGLRELAEEEANFLQAPVYESAPLDCPPDSPFFLNTVVEIGFSSSAHHLLEATQKIQKKLGRKKNSTINSPRTIDLDLLYYGEKIIKEKDLSIPHPQLANRLFVIKPLADIRPHLVLPSYKLTVQELLLQLDSTCTELKLHRTSW